MSKSKEQNAEKLKALQLTMEKLDKTFGKGSVMKLGDSPVEKLEVIPTGSITLDLALGINGYPKGRVVEIYGPESSGKTTLAIHAIAEVQKQGGIAAFIDAEHAFDQFYAQKLGVDVANLLISQPDNGEQALEIADNLIRSGAIDLVVIDSVAALTPKAEIEGEMGDSQMGLQARLMSKALRKLTGSINKAGCCCIFINQLRDKIGVMFGNPETTTGGNALKFYSSVRIDIRRAAQIKEGKVRDEVMDEFENADKDVRLLAYRMVLENFNTKIISDKNFLNFFLVLLIFNSLLSFTIILYPEPCVPLRTNCFGKALKLICETES